MRLTFVAFAFIFFINVLAMPINPNTVALRRRSPHEHNTLGNKAVAEYKRATPDGLMEALRTVDEKHPLLDPEWTNNLNCGVYHLTEKVDNENVILKVIISGVREPEREAWGNYNVGQLLGWAHTPNKVLYYLFIKNMGVLLQDTELKDDPNQVRELKREAIQRYRSQYHLRHDDMIKEDNWVFRKVNDKWKAELIDWEIFTKESDYRGYKEPPQPFLINANRVFVPSKMREHLGTINL